MKTEERRRRFQKSLRNIQDIHCRNFALHNLTEFRIIQFDETFVAQFDEFRKLEEEEINSEKESAESD